MNFVTPRRYWMTFLPFAAVINFSDFVFHRPANFTRGRLITFLVALACHVPYTYLTFKLWGGWFTLLVFLPLTQLGFHHRRVKSKGAQVSLLRPGILQTNSHWKHPPSSLSLGEPMTLSIFRVSTYPTSFVSTPRQSRHPESV
jgi:hypothetical protein